MKKISTIELTSLYGGKRSSNCMWNLQYEANTHVSSGDKKAEERYWNDWANRFDACAGA